MTTSYFPPVRPGVPFKYYRFQEASGSKFDQFLTARDPRCMRSAVEECELSDTEPQLKPQAFRLPSRRLTHLESLGGERNDRSRDVTSSHPGPPPFSFSFPHPPHHIEDILYPHTPLAKTGLGRRRWFPNQLRGSQPPTRLPQTPSTSRGLEALRAFAQYSYSTPRSTCTRSQYKCDYIHPISTDKPQ